MHENGDIKSMQNTNTQKKITSVKPSKYEASEAIRSNKKYWRKIYADIETAAFLPSETTKSIHWSEALPKELYEKVCNSLGVPKILQTEEKPEKVPEIVPNKITKEALLSLRKSIFVEREMDSDTDVELSPREDNDDKYNIHYEFLKKPEREQITWKSHYLQPEKEEEKSLVRKADDVTNRIADEFCDYMRELGGNQQSQLFTPKAVKELFEVEFDTHVARSLLIVPKEMPTVEDGIANLTGHPEKSRYAALEREISKGIIAECQPDHLKAFGRSIPKRDQRRAPQNNTKDMWRSSRFVPKDLVTLKTVWEGITSLRSVKEYCRWMIENPEYRRAPYLNSLGMFDPAVLQARLTLESQHPLFSPALAATDNVPAPIEHLRHRLSQLADTT